MSHFIFVLDFGNANVNLYEDYLFLKKQSMHSLSDSEIISSYCNYQ